MALVFLPERRKFFWWEDERPAFWLAAAVGRGEPAEVELVTSAKRARVAGTALGLFDTVAGLSVTPVAVVPALSGSVSTWTLASKLALELVSRERVVPTIVRCGGKVVARWGAALSASDDAARVHALALSMPPAAHAVPAPAGNGRDVWAPEALLRAFLDATVDVLIRATRGEPELPAASREARGTHGRRQSEDSDDDDYTPWERRWEAALSAGDGTFETEGFGERRLLEDLGSWSEPALGARDRLRACFRLELPDADDHPFLLRFFLQSPDDPSLLVTAAEVWSTRGRSLAKFGRAFRDPQESLL
ncbi:ATP-dependent helicase, partial [Myxococcota bacterium]